jgi:hypothetical protein
MQAVVNASLPNGVLFLPTGRPVDADKNIFTILNTITGRYGNTNGGFWFPKITSGGSACNEALNVFSNNYL